ncbi:MAG TPA: hypothetical protein VNM92_08010 [Thermoanaerobaculia bacterium]|nr:hypothetical protein [Thermoanaerobaculia bacterium]
MTQSLLLTVYLFEAGIFFVVSPWTRFWLRNPLLHFHPDVALMADNGFVRGFVAGIGIIHLLVAMRDVGRLMTANREEGE